MLIGSTVTRILRILTADFVLLIYHGNVMIGLDIGEGIRGAAVFIICSKYGRAAIHRHSIQRIPLISGKGNGNIVIVIDCNGTSAQTIRLSRTVCNIDSNGVGIWRKGPITGEVHIFLHVRQVVLSTPIAECPGALHFAICGGCCRRCAARRHIAAHVHLRVSGHTQNRLRRRVLRARHCICHLDLIGLSECPVACEFHVFGRHCKCAVIYRHIIRCPAAECPGARYAIVGCLPCGEVSGHIDGFIISILVIDRRRTGIRGVIRASQLVRHLILRRTAGAVQIDDVVVPIILVIGFEVVLLILEVRFRHKQICSVFTASHIPAGVHQLATSICRQRFNFLAGFELIVHISEVRRCLLSTRCSRSMRVFLSNLDVLLVIIRITNLRFFNRWTVRCQR